MDAGMNDRDRISASTRRGNVWRLLSDGQWHTTMEVNAVDVGGSEGCRRVRELREECRTGKRPGWVIECRRLPRCRETTQWGYRVRPIAVAAVLP
jgi:hypothetical protein